MGKQKKGLDMEFLSRNAGNSLILKSTKKNSMSNKNQLNFHTFHC